MVTSKVSLSEKCQDVYSELLKFCVFSTLISQHPPTMPALGLQGVLENLLTTLNQNCGISSWKMSSQDKSTTTVVLRFAGPPFQADPRATRSRRVCPSLLRRDEVRREAFVTRKAADSSNVPPCPPPPSVHPPSCDIITTTSQQDITLINGQATRSASYSKDPNVTNQISLSKI